MTKKATMSADNFKFENTYADLPPIFYEVTAPTTVPNPEVILFNDSLVSQLGLEPSTHSPQEWAQILSGNVQISSGRYIAQAYAGHQFGYFTLLGDGRALLMGEHRTPQGRLVDIQLKGSGPTIFSRRGDGRAALGPMIREYIVSEGLANLGVLTTRSLAVVKTGQLVFREVPLTGAILTRVAASHIRVGTFQFAAAQQDLPTLQALIDYTIGRHYPEIQGHSNPALTLLRAVRDRQIDLIVSWMKVGFIHGVMNTDNMSIAGETIDLGPCAFLDEYHAMKVFSSIDRSGRYAFGNQPSIAKWNLTRFAEAMIPSIEENNPNGISQAEEILNEFDGLFESAWTRMMLSKLGLVDLTGAKGRPLIEKLLGLMQKFELDYTRTFRELSRGPEVPEDFTPHPDLNEWHRDWMATLQETQKLPEQIFAQMQLNNPARIPRNHQVHEALEEAQAGNLAPTHKLLAALRNPYSDDPSLESYEHPPRREQRIEATFCGT